MSKKDALVKQFEEYAEEIKLDINVADLVKAFITHAYNLGHSDGMALARDIATSVKRNEL